MATTGITKRDGTKARKRRVDRRHLVYRITCEPTQETYIGITVCNSRALWKCLATRWTKHMYHACVEMRPHLLQRAIRKYGEESFSYEILSVVRGKAAAHEEERRLIAKHEPELNVECTVRKKIGKRPAKYNTSKKSNKK